MPSSTGRPPLQPLSLSTQPCQSASISFLRLRFISDRESTTLKWCTYPPFPKVNTRNRRRIQIATDQMNGADSELLISLSQVVSSPETKRWDYGLGGSLSQSSGCKCKQVHLTHTYRIQFCLQHFYYIFDSFFKESLTFHSCFRCIWGLLSPLGKLREELSRRGFTLCIICKKGFRFLRQSIKLPNPQFMPMLLWNGF